MREPATTRRWQAGLASQLELEEIRRLSIAARTEHVDVLRDSVAACIGLYRAADGDQIRQHARCRAPQLETEIARKIENSLSALQGVKHIYTMLQDGSVSVTIELRLEKPTQEALDDVRDPVITKSNIAGTPILTYTVASSRMDEEALSWFVDQDVSRAILSVRGVGAVALVGVTLRVTTLGDYDQALAKLKLSQRQVPIVVRLSEDARQDLNLPPRLTVPGTHCPAMLANIVDIEITSGPAQIDRYDRSRTINIEAELNGLPLGEMEARASTL